jgi:hypothetical protein
MSSVLDSDSDLPSENYVLNSLNNFKSQEKIKNPIKQEIIIISSDEEELPSVETLLANISKKRKIISISKDSEESQTSDNDDYIFSHKNKEYRIKKCEIQENLKRFKKRFRTKTFLNMINKLVKNFKENVFFKELQKMERAKRKNLLFVYNRFYDFFPGYYGYQGYEIIFEHILDYYVDSIEYDRDKCDLISEVFIPEIGTFLIMEDFKVDHDLANEIRKDSAEYGFENFYGEKDKSYSTKKIDLFIESFKDETPVIIN